MYSHASTNQFLLGLAWLGKSLTILLSSIFTVLGIVALYIKFSLDEQISHFLWILLMVTGFLLTFVVTIQLIYWLSKPIILKPINKKENTQQSTIGLIFIQGEGVKAEAYMEISGAIQAAASDLDIWVGIPKFIGESPIPRELGLAVNNTMRKMKQQGMPETAHLFFIAHSVSGIALAKYLKAFHESVNAKGQILMGSYLGKWYFSNLDSHGKTIINYPIPTLTIGGTLDGLARITRIATAYWYQQINPSEHSQLELEKFPVVVIEGASHMQFAKVPPNTKKFFKEAPFVAEFDLKPTANEEHVHQQVGEFIHNFICTILFPEKELISPEKQKPEAYWEHHRTEAQNILQPIINAFQQEGYYGFKPPFYGTYPINPRPEADNNDTLITNKNPKCFTPGSPWVQEHANPFMAALNEFEQKYSKTFILDKKEVTDNFHPSFPIFSEVHLPTINWNGKEKGRSKQTPCDHQGDQPCHLYKVTSATQALYNWFEDFDTGLFPISAFSLRAKLNSRQKFWHFAGVAHPDFQETDGASLGAAINQQAYQWAIENAGETAREYFNQFGNPMVMEADIIPIIKGGPSWLWNYPKYYFLFLNGTYHYVVRSVILKTDINYPIRAVSGFHYCHLLSPAAATEWIYVDGLRLNASVSGNTFVYGPVAGIVRALRFILRGVLRQVRIKGLGFLKRI